MASRYSVPALKFFSSVAIFLLGFHIGRDNVEQAESDDCFPSRYTNRVEENTNISCTSECPKYPQFPLEIHMNVDEKVLDVAFDMLFHTESPAVAEVFISNNLSWKSLHSCESIYHIRTAIRSDEDPSTCLALAHVPRIYAARTMNMYRFGHVNYPQILTNQYQDDIIHPHGYFQQKLLLPPLLRDMPEIISSFQQLLGPALRNDGSRKTAIIMVANEGVLDLVMNIICSAQSANIDMTDFILFSAQAQYVPLIQNMGIKAIYHPSFGNIPAGAAGNYADVTFGYLMWLKVIAAYVA